MAVVPPVCRIALPSPLYRLFDYLAPHSGFPLAPGMRVRVPFGRREAIGILHELAAGSALPPARLKPVREVLDREPLLPDELYRLLAWVADYYHHPLGEVLHAALPVALRRGQAAEAHGVAVWSLTDEGRALDPDRLRRAPRRRRLYERLHAAPQGLTEPQLAEVSPRWQPTLRDWLARGWVARAERDCLEPAPPAAPAAPVILGAAQEAALAAIRSALGRFECLLLHGVTGSGKTEVYLEAIGAALACGGQALLLVPEIALTPQLVARARARHPLPIALLHSGLSEQERLCAWLMAREGRAPIVIGTRSAVFAPLPRLALIVVDEEHDGSYKQQDGLRYSARDVAIMRARRRGVPVVLGSATPSLESLHNAALGRYRRLELPERAATAELPAVRLLDLRRLALHEGLSAPLLEAIGARLERGEQSLIYLNRRGFAPVLMCHACGWLAPCGRCDARLTLHKRSHRLHCHHCGAQAPLPARCPQCGAAELHGLGEGTERIEQALARRFPRARLERIDRDSTRRKGALEEKLGRAQAGAADILIGTQMLAKGHDFPNLTLVGVVNADQGLYSVDFRAGETLFQRILQVAGRAGRAAKPGEVLIQTWHPDNPVFAALARHDYDGYARAALEERREAQYPPFAHLALLRAESPRPGAALAFLAQARAAADGCAPAPAVQIMEPVPAPMERRAGRYRAQLLVQSAERAPLHGFLSCWMERLAESKAARRVRWSLDVDPMDLY
jgi:primosomal protein N' (replication factor Y)